MTGNVTLDCPKFTLCPIVTPVLCSNGLCVERPEFCADSTKVSCTGDKPHYCSAGHCVASAA